MQPKQKAQAGTFESSDIMILIEPKEQDGDNSVEISSSVGKQFGTQIKKVIEQVLATYEISGIHLIAKDKGALSQTIAARMETAVKRALGQAKGTLE